MKPAAIKVAPPIDVKDHAAAYDQTRRETVQADNSCMKSAVRERLEGMEVTGSVVSNEYQKV